MRASVADAPGMHVAPRSRMNAFSRRAIGSLTSLALFALLTGVAGCGGTERPPRATGTADGGPCIDLALSPQDRACTKDADCVATMTGSVCAGYVAAALCANSAANSAGAARIASQIKSLPQGSPSTPTDFCDVAAGPIFCARGQCTYCNEVGSCPELDAGSCAYPVIQNDSRCPATYLGDAALAGPCSPVGLECEYPGAGDGDQATCSAATAIMWCRAAGGGDAGDGGASVGSWIVAQ
jgi:hypothetical protein